jgi:hypothetical protein
VHIGEPSLFRFYVLDKINASLIPLLFKPFVKFDIAYSPPLGDICVLSDTILILGDFRFDSIINACQGPSLGQEMETLFYEG